MQDRLPVPQFVFLFSRRQKILFQGTTCRDLERESLKNLVTREKVKNESRDWESCKHHCEKHFAEIVEPFLQKLHDAKFLKLLNGKKNLPYHVCGRVHPAKLSLPSWRKKLHLALGEKTASRPQNLL